MLTFLVSKDNRHVYVSNFQLKGVKVQADAPAAAHNPASYFTFGSVQSTGNVSDLMDRIFLHDILLPRNPPVSRPANEPVSCAVLTRAAVCSRIGCGFIPATQPAQTNESHQYPLV